jgi:hypothetical protein
MKREEDKNKMNKSAKKIAPLSQPEKAHIEDLLKSALQDYAVRQTKVVKDRRELADRLTSIISEYLGPFMLLGYDTKGEPFNIIHAYSQMDIDAITTAINKFIFNMHNQE